MTELLVLMVAAIAVIAGAAVLGPRLGIASPLVLVAIGVGASFLPAFEAIHIEPAWILEGVLPPLLYSSAVSMPAMNFRREFGAISGLSILLVVATSLLLGVFFMLAIPGLGFAWGVALGAIISPTDAVATTIIRQSSVSKRVVAILDGESLLNDATALVVLRTAIVATAAAFSFWSAVGSFVYSVVVATGIGLAVAWLNLAVRKRIADPAINTVISFAVPFLASVPAGLLGASGLVAAVTAGLFTGVRAPRDLSPRNRLSDSQNWRTIELVLEGGVFLTMGLQIKSIVMNVEQHHEGAGAAVLVAIGALVVTILVRAAYVAPLLHSLGRRIRRQQGRQTRIEGMRDQMSTPEGKQLLRQSNRRLASERDFERFARRVTQSLADMEYFLREPLGWRHGTVIVWAGMRGAVTVAAAQTLPDATPQRAALVLVAFVVAVLSLLVQGTTIGPLLRLIGPGEDRAEIDERNAELARIAELLRTTAQGVQAPPRSGGGEGFRAASDYRLSVIAAQRAALLDARDNGTFDADILEDALANLDASEIAIEIRGRLTG
jgi:CPA1 family monovalent cation:H+ antiporter